MLQKYIANIQSEKNSTQTTNIRENTIIDVKMQIDAEIKKKNKKK